MARPLPRRVLQARSGRSARPLIHLKVATGWGADRCTKSTERLVDDWAWGKDASAEGALQGLERHPLLVVAVTQYGQRPPAAERSSRFSPAVHVGEVARDSQEPPRPRRLLTQMGA